MELHEEEIVDLKKALSQPQNIVITTHKDPDGDALGSSLALYQVLKSRGHSVDVALPSAYSGQFHWLPCINDVLIADVDMDEITEKLHHASLIFYLDFNGLDRIERLAEDFDAATCTKVMIDHHMDPEPIVDIMITEPASSSTCEMVFDVATRLYGDDCVTEDIATCLYTGIVTDTGSFKYNVRPQLFHSVAQLLEAGIDSNKIQDLIFNAQSGKYLKLLGYLITERMELIPEWQTGIFFLSKKDYTDFDIQRGDTEGLINYLMQLNDVKVAVFFKQQPNIVKLSLRSKGDISVQEIARDLFKGGGHKNASGGIAFTGLKSAMDKFKNALPKYLSKYPEITEYKIKK